MNRSRDYIDIIGGGLLVAGGIWFIQHAGQYNMGTAQRMGPGYFPTIIGGLMSALGAALLVPALFRGGELPRPEWQPFLAIALSVLAFALVVGPFGLVPAVVVLTVVAAVAEGRPPVLRTILLAAALSTIAVVVFTQGLGIPVPAFRMPR